MKEIKSIEIKYEKLDNVTMASAIVNKNPELYDELKNLFPLINDDRLGYLFNNSFKLGITDALSSKNISIDQDKSIDGKIVINNFSNDVDDFCTANLIKKVLDLIYDISKTQPSGKQTVFIFSEGGTEISVWREIFLNKVNTTSVQYHIESNCIDNTLESALGNMFSMSDNFKKEIVENFVKNIITEKTSVTTSTIKNIVGTYYVESFTEVSEIDAVIVGKLISLIYDLKKREDYIKTQINMPYDVMMDDKKFTINREFSQFGDRYHITMELPMPNHLNSPFANVSDEDLENIYLDIFERDGSIEIFDTLPLDQLMVEDIENKLLIKKYLRNMLKKSKE